MKGWFGPFFTIWIILMISFIFFRLDSIRDRLNAHEDFYRQVDQMLDANMILLEYAACREKNEGACYLYLEELQRAIEAEYDGEEGE